MKIRLLNGKTSFQIFKENLNNLILGILFLSFLLSSCESNSDLITPESDPKLVLFSMICPSDTIIKVKVNATENLFGEKVDRSEQLKKVQIQFSDGNQEYSMSALDEDNFCSLKLQVKAGNTYSIKASCPGFPEANASCTIPEVWNPHIVIKTDPSKDTEYSRFVNFSFEDHSENINYYLVMVFEEQYSKVYESTVLPLYSDGYTDNNGGYCFKDQNFNQDFSGNYSAEYLDSTVVKMYLQEFDSEYYKYYKSLGTYTGSDDPFTEYSPVYTNISQGYGIFTGYNKYLRTITFK